MEKEKASQEKYGSSIPYKSICTKKAIPSAHCDQEDVLSTACPDAYCLTVLCGEPLRKEMVSVLRAVSLVGRLSRKNIEDVNLLICLELKIWNQGDMEEQMCVYMCVCVCIYIYA